MFFTDSLKIDIIGIFLALAIALLTWHKWTLGYWKRKGVPGPEPALIFGNVKDLFMGKKTIGENYKRMYFELKSKGLRHGGGYFMGSPTYIPIDLEIVKSILQNDFQHFHTHGVYYDEKIDPLSANVFNLDGPKWKEIRSIVSPTFTAGKLRMMQPTIVECSVVLDKVLEESAGKNPIDIRDIMNRFTIDVIGSVAFGLEIDSLRNPNNTFRVYGSKALEPTLSNILRYLPMVLLSVETLRKLRYSPLSADLRHFFYNMVESTVKYREESKVVRKDFMNLLVELKNKPNSENKETQDRLTLNDIAAQCFIFFIAGFETSASTINFASYELATNPDIQEKTREEINRVLKKYNNELTYDAVIEMEYLERVIQETLRKYPPLQYLFRRCTKNYKVPGEPGIEIEDGTIVMIPILGIHYDPEYYTNPEKFDPDRFTEEVKRTRPPFSWLPFGEGPRICLGMRFGMIETKMGIISLLKNFKITLNEKTVSPIRYSTTGLVATCKGGIWLDLEKISTHN